MKYFGITICFLLLILSTIKGVSQPFGIKVCGPEFGQTKFPGVYGVDFIYPDSSELQYFHNKGFRMIDIPFRWERVQPKLMGELDSVEMNRMYSLIGTCNSIGLQVKLTLQNFGRYTMNDKVWVVGSKQ
jgi:endoglucanase